MCQVSTNSSTQQQRRVFLALEPDSRFQSKKQIKKCWFQLKVQRLHYIPLPQNIYNYFRDYRQHSQNNLNLHKNLHSRILSMTDLNNSYHTVVSFTCCLLILQFMTAIAGVSQTQTIYMSAAQEQAKKSLLPRRPCYQQICPKKTTEAGDQLSS